MTSTDTPVAAPRKPRPTREEMVQRTQAKLAKLQEEMAFSATNSHPAVKHLRDARTQLRAARKTEGRPFDNIADAKVDALLEALSNLISQFGLSRTSS